METITVHITAPNLTKHPKGLAAFDANGIRHHINRYGVVFAPSTPDLFEGWATLNFGDDTVRDAVRSLIRPALLRTEGFERIYSLREIRKIFKSL